MYRDGGFMKRNGLIGLAAAGLAALAFTSILFAQNAKPQGATTKGQAKDFTGVWRRSRRPPDTKRQYSTFEIVFSLTNQEPPMTPWGMDKYKAAKADAGPRGVSLSETNDPVFKCFPPACQGFILFADCPLRSCRTPAKW